MFTSHTSTVAQLQNTLYSQFFVRGIKINESRRRDEGMWPGRLRFCHLLSVKSTRALLPPPSHATPHNFASDTAEKHNGKCSLLLGYSAVEFTFYWGHFGLSHWQLQQRQTKAENVFDAQLTANLVIHFAYEVNTINNTHTLTRTHPHKHVQTWTVSFNLIKTELNWIELNAL